jgi:acetoin:2,6-dichlorophenolindophenol oxidoreductase subunit beta
MRNIKYSQALAEATMHAMAENPKVFLMGEGIDDPKGTFGTTLEAYKKYGSERVFDTPLSESAVTGIGIGAAIEGWPCVMIHMRNEFLLLGIDQVINHAAKWRYMFAGVMSCPIVIRCIVGRGWGQAAQHSQSLHALFSHIPGLKVILPATPYDAKGLLYSAIKDPNPVICIEHRWLYDKTGEVPVEAYEIPIGKANILSPGTDVTCVAISHQIYDALAAKEILAKEGIDMEVIDLRCTRPIDLATIISSVRKTGRLFITDTAVKTGGISAEISAAISEQAFDLLKAPILRVALPDCPTPCSYALERSYYPSVQDLCNAARRLVTGRILNSVTAATGTDHAKPFTGPF